jgi:hypothetical protein
MDFILPSLTIIVAYRYYVTVVPWYALIAYDYPSTFFRGMDDLIARLPKIPPTAIDRAGWARCKATQSGSAIGARKPDFFFFPTPRVSAVDSHLKYSEVLLFPFRRECWNLPFTFIFGEYAIFSNLEGHYRLARRQTKKC